MELDDCESRKRASSFLLLVVLWQNTMRKRSLAIKKNPDEHTHRHIIVYRMFKEKQRRRNMKNKREYSMVVKDEDSSIMTAILVLPRCRHYHHFQEHLCRHCCLLMLSRLHIPMCKVFKTTKLCS